MTKPLKGATPDTRLLLLTAARDEFVSVGYAGTDTNKIARRAGFAPQTFYRHFGDKLEVFLEVYAQWRRDEQRALAEIARAEPKATARAERVARALAQFHTSHAVFRRSLRVLAISEPRARAARAQSRSDQIATLAALPANGRRSRAALLAAILEIERLCDAVADAETDDLAIDKDAFLAEIARAVLRARGEG